MILDKIAKKTAERIKMQKNTIPIDIVKKSAKAMPADSGFPFETALKSTGISFICEVKKASPSKGVIAEDFPYLDIAKEYEAAGAAAISVLTEPLFFQGKNQYLKEIVQNVEIPVLRKDFTIDEYQVYEAKIIGASAILLICKLLDTTMLKKYIHIADELGLSALVEAHSEEEVASALNAGARIIGVNNRDLQTFTVDLNTSIRLRKLIPPHILFVSESGIRNASDVASLKNNQTDAVLIGETLMRSPNKKQILDELRGDDNG